MAVASHTSYSKNPIKIKHAQYKFPLLTKYASDDPEKGRQKI